MPDKWVDNLKDDISREVAQQWQDDLGIGPIKTSEWDYAGSRSGEGASDSQIADEIIERRKNK